MQLSGLALWRRQRREPEPKHSMADLKRLVRDNNTRSPVISDFDLEAEIGAALARNILKQRTTET